MAAAWPHQMATPERAGLDPMTEPPRRAMSSQQLFEKVENPTPQAREAVADVCQPVPVSQLAATAGAAADARRGWHDWREARARHGALPLRRHAAAPRGRSLTCCRQVGLPARGKTHMAKRLERYLAFFHGSMTKVFNVGEYRRRAEAAAAQSGPVDLPKLQLPTSDSAFFNPLDANASRERLNFAQAAVRDMIAFLFEGEDLNGISPRGPNASSSGVTSPRGPAATSVGWEEKGNVDVVLLPSGTMRALDSGRVAIFDATNSTRKRRQWLREQLAHLPIKLLFIESVCTDEKMVDENIRNAKVGLPEFSHLSPEEAFRDFKRRIKHYESVYEPMDEARPRCGRAPQL